MAAFNEINDRSVAVALAARLGLNTPAPPQLGTDVTPTIDLGTTLEIQYHMGWRRWSSTTWLTNAIAAQNIRFQLRNPDNGKTMIRIEQLIVQATGNDLVNLGVMGVGPGIPDLSTVLSGASPLDGRMTPKPSTPAQGFAVLSFQSQVPTALGQRTGTTVDEMSLQLTANNNYSFVSCQGRILMPGNALFAENQTPTQALIVQWIWRERPLNDTEGQS